ncbi:alpha/beta fold hydrolase [Flavobacterium sp. JP2137]|uniref:alpha/beta fold hydrolase n=1 Tax=Flavobacterium sp. JP2137 TaxID=3414510 RepID=UPI003D2FFB90
MSKYKITIIIFIFTALYVNAFGQSNNYFFEVQKTGEGAQAMIFIPGFACSGEVWNETITKFESEYTCYSLTMAGFSGVKPQINSSFNNWATSIADFIKDNNIDKPIIVGHSMGGVLALAIASDYPNLIDKIIVVDGLPCLSAIMNPSFKSNENNDCSSVVNQITTMSDEQFYQLQKMSIPQLLTDTAIQEKVVSWSVKSDRKTIAEMFCDFSNTDLREKIQNIKCPSLILLEASFINIKTNIEDQYKNLKTAHLQYANKGLHFIMYDDKEWYFTQINNFLATQ